MMLQFFLAPSLLTVQVLVLLAVTVARITGRWDSTLTARDYARLVPAIEDIQH